MIKEEQEERTFSNQSSNRSLKLSKSSENSSKIEDDSIKNIDHDMQNYKDPKLKKLIGKSVDLIGKKLQFDESSLKKCSNLDKKIMSTLVKSFERKKLFCNSKSRYKFVTHKKEDGNKKESKTNSLNQVTDLIDIYSLK